MDEVGRPTAFRPEFVEQARKLARETGHAAHMALWLDATRRYVIASRKRKRRNTPSSRVRNSVFARMWAALKGRTDGALFSRLGYTAKQLVAHLEGQIAPGMSWRNYGRWHIDHKKPCALFDLTSEQQFVECWCLDNLQPLWAKDNIKKGAKYGTA